MSWFRGDDGEGLRDLRRRWRARSWPSSSGCPLLGRVPLVPALREGGDTGAPIVVDRAGVGGGARSFVAIAEQIEEITPRKIYRSELSINS